MSNNEVRGKFVDPYFEDKIRVAREARGKGEDPAKAVEDYMKNIKTQQ